MFILSASDMYNDISTIQECSQLRDLAKESVVRLRDSDKTADKLIGALVVYGRAASNKGNVVQEQCRVLRDRYGL